MRRIRIGGILPPSATAGCRRYKLTRAKPAPASPRVIGLAADLVDPLSSLQIREMLSSFVPHATHFFASQMGSSGVSGSCLAASTFVQPSRIPVAICAVRPVCSSILPFVRRGCEAMEMIAASLRLSYALRADSTPTQWHSSRDAERYRRQSIRPPLSPTTQTRLDDRSAFAMDARPESTSLIPTTSRLGRRSPHVPADRTTNPDTANPLR